jgi:hypothetical protein
MLREISDEVYVPLSERTLRKLDQLVLIFETAGEGYSEDRIIRMGLDNLLACMRQADVFANENFPGVFSDMTTRTTQGEMGPAGG